MTNLQTAGQGAKPAKEPETFVDLFSKLANQSASLVQDEITLVRQEVGEKLQLYKPAVALLIIGGGVTLIAAATLSAAITLLLATRFEAWIAALITTLIFVFLGCLLLVVAKNAMQKLNL